MSDLSNSNNAYAQGLVTRKQVVTDRRNGATDVRRNGATNR